MKIIQKNYCNTVNFEYLTAYWLILDILTIYSLYPKFVIFSVISMDFGHWDRHNCSLYLAFVIFAQKCSPEKLQEDRSLPIREVLFIRIYHSEILAYSHSFWSPSLQFHAIVQIHFPVQFCTEFLLHVQTRASFFQAHWFCDRSKIIAKLTVGR